MAQSCTVWYTLSTVVPRSRGPLHPIGASANSRMVFSSVRGPFFPGGGVDPWAQAVTHGHDEEKLTLHTSQVFVVTPKK